MNSKEKKIGFVGVGRMGANMARNLKDKGYSISCVNDVNKNAATSLADELGCAHAETLAQVTAQSDIVLTVVTSDAAMESIFFGSEDNLFQMAAGTLFINCATLSPQESVQCLLLFPNRFSITSLHCTHHSNCPPSCSSQDCSRLSGAVAEMPSLQSSVDSHAC